MSEPTLERKNLRMFVGWTDAPFREREPVYDEVSDAEFDRIATEQGYVKLPNFDEFASLSEHQWAEAVERAGYVKLDDVTYIDPNGVEVMKYRDERHVVLHAAELRERYVKRPVCGTCKGKPLAEGEYWDGQLPNGEPDFDGPCPSCGGTGFGRLVALDGIDVGPDAQTLIGMMAPLWNLTDWEAEGKVSMQGTRSEIIAEAWKVINHLAESHDALRGRVLTALDGGQE